MTATRQRKNKSQRGHHTHGWGAKKKHRGAGHRGGRGNAGSGKRGDAKKPTYLRDKAYQMKNKGFSSKSRSAKPNPVNIAYVEKKLDILKSNGIAVDNKGVLELDLQKLRYNKLLSQGKLTKKVTIIVHSASKKAIEKVEAAGGKVILKSTLQENPKVETKVSSQKPEKPKA